MFPNCIDRFGRKKRETKVQQTNKQTNKQRKTKEKKKKNGNNSTYHEPLSEEWIGRRS